MEERSRVTEDRLRKLEGLRGEGVEPYATGFRPSATCRELLTAAASEPPPDMNELSGEEAGHAVAGRVMAKHVMGKAMFLRIRDRSVGDDPDGPGSLQLHARRNVVGEELYQLLKKQVDVGDFLGVEGPLFRTRTDETTVMIHRGRLLTKSIRPLPEKWHGLQDVETRHRQRYVDLVMNPDVKGTFKARATVVSAMRRFFEDRDFIEVETPMMQPIPGGAAARPFETWHNALGMPLYLRIAPELYLKRLLVGGLERVFELNRNFRNEGVSPQHNPEFTMLEFYQAYATYPDLMALTEELFEGLAQRLNGDGSTVRRFGEHDLDWGRPYRRLTLREALVEVGGLDAATRDDPEQLGKALREQGLEVDPGWSHGETLMAAFEELVEDHLLQPTYVTDFPIEVSPLARRNEADPSVADRFELFVAGTEIANGFSELNDPIDQRERFEEQVRAREAGDDEAMLMDRDYVRALEYGMPPAAGEGIGIDRLLMLLTDRHSIREVILFPHMRPQDNEERSTAGEPSE